MAQQTIDIGAAPNDGTGDPFRDAFDKCNDNFTELYAGLVGLLDFKGSTDCSANPNYPAASKGDFYVVSVAGKIGGASGVTVEVGDAYFALADNAGGTQAGVGTSWTVIQGNIVGSSITELDDIPDVNAPTPANGDVLTWDSTPGEWVPQAPTGSGITELDDVPDVNAPSPANGDVLTWDSTPGEWVPAAPTGGTALSALFEDQKAANTAGGGSTSGSWVARTLNTEVYDDIGLALLASTVTITIATPGVITWNSHGLIANSTVVFTTTGALPTGLTAGTTYYVLSSGLTANTFQVATAPGGTAINTTGSQSGTHTATASAISLAAGTYEVDASTQLYRTDRRRARLQDITNSVTLALSDTQYGVATTSGDQSAPRVHGRFTLAGTAIVELQYRVETTQATNGLGVQSNFGVVEIYSRLKLTKLS